MRAFLLCATCSALVAVERPGGLSQGDAQEGGLALSPVLAYSSFTKHLAGTRVVSSGGRVEQVQATVRADLRLTGSLTLDLGTGWGRVRGPLGDDRGLLDSSLGLAWRFQQGGDGHPWRYGLAARAGLILAGSYEAGGPEALGDAANGGQVSLGGQLRHAGGFGVDLEAGVRDKSEGVPIALFATGRLAHRLAWAEPWVGFRYDGSVSGGDFGAVPDQEVKRIAGFAEAGLDLHLGGHRLGLFAAKAMLGRNKGEKTVIGLSGGLAF